MVEKEKWGVLMRSDHPLAQKDVIVKEDLLHVPLIMTDRLSLQKEIENWCGYPLSELGLFGTYNIITNVAMLVDSGATLAITIEGAVNLFGSDRLVFKPLFPELAMTSVLAWKKFQSNFGVCGRFLEHLRSIQ